ncbi:MAG: enoyl-CoA hydratase-related protein [Colwellia sp.]
MKNLIISDVSQGILTITLNRLDKKNALNNLMYEELCRLFTDADTNPSIHCVLIKGDENCFCAGNDLQDFLACSQDDDLLALTFVRILAAFTKPIIAAVAGAAVGIGTTLLLHCDMVIAATNSKFKLPFTQLGLCPEAGSSLILTRLVGQNKAFELMVLGKGFNAEEALSYGIASQVCEPEVLIDTAAKIAQSIAKLPLDSVITSRRLIRQATQPLLDSVIKDEGSEFKRLITTDDCKTILANFFK